MENSIAKYLTTTGLWAVNEIKVKVINENLAYIYYKKYDVFADKYRIKVKLGYFERRKGATLEDKISETLIKLKKRLSIENEQIKKHKELEAKFN